MSGKEEVQNYLAKSENEEEAIARICLLSTPNLTIAKEGKTYTDAKKCFSKQPIKSYAQKIYKTYKKGHVGTPIIKILNDLSKKYNNCWLMPDILKNNAPNKLIKDGKKEIAQKPSDFNHTKVMVYILWLGS